MELEWEGVVYEVPTDEPPDNRDAAGLHRLFREPLEAYVAFAGELTPYELRIGECRRTLERQLYLLGSGRTRPGAIKSRTLESRHRFGLAADLVLVDGQGQAIWDAATWNALYASAPPQWYGLTDIRPFEQVHLEALYADQMILRAQELNLHRT